MSDKHHRKTCKCGRGKVSLWDGKCGHCRNENDKVAHQRMLDGWTKDEARMGFRMKVRQTNDR